MQLNIDIDDSWAQLLQSCAERTGKSISASVLDRGIKELVRREAIDSMDALVTNGDPIPDEIVALSKLR